ncbi:MAG TPA: DUF535 family protein [Telluria sp.]|nr:DUF535 family protein [Telluria sp.]
MKLYRGAPGWAEQMVANAEPSVTIRSGVSRDLRPVPYWRELIKLKMRSMAHREHTARWLKLLNSHPAFSDYVRNYPRFLYKIYRPYLTNTLSMDDRLGVLASHYQFVFEQGLGAVIGQASHMAVPLAHVTGKGGTPYTVSLRAIGPLEREGELVLQLSSAGVLMYSVAFTFAWRGEGHAVSIGCIQGGKDEGTMDAIRAATRELHGMRPKQLLITLVRQLGHEYGCREMLLVSNMNRVVRGAMRQGRVLADYDQVWAEMGAERRADGDFALPCVALAAPDMEAIPSRKRSEARKRYEMMASVAAAASARLAERSGC